MPTNQLASFPPQPPQTNQFASFPPQPAQWTAVQEAPQSGGWQNVQSTETRLPSSFAPVTQFQSAPHLLQQQQSFPAPVQVTEHQPAQVQVQPLKTEPVTVHVSVNSEKDEEFQNKTNSTIHPSRQNKSALGGSSGGGKRRSAPPSSRRRSPPSRRRGSSPPSSRRRPR